METANATTLDQIEARLKARAEGPTDLSKYPLVEHSDLGVMLRVVPMSAPDYDAWRNLVYFEQQQHEDSGAAKNGAPMKREKGDKFLLTHAVYSGDGAPLPDGVAQQLLTGAFSGPSTRRVILVAEYQNPPREELSREIHILLAKSQAEMLLWKVLFQSGLGASLIDKISPNATPEEKEIAERNIQKARDAVVAFEPFFQIQEAALDLGVQLT